MLTDAFVKEFVGVVNKANGPVTIQVPGGPGHQYLMRQPDGSYTVQYADEFPESHDAFDIDSLIRKATDFQLGGDSGKGDVWYSRRMTASHHGRDCVVLALGTSPQLNLLLDWEKQGKAQLDQEAFVYLLRTTLAGTYLTRTDLLDMVSKIDIRKGQNVAAEMAKGKVSVTRAMMAEAVGADKLPDTVAFTVPIWSQASMQSFVQGVVCALDLNAQTEKFVLSPLPGSIEKAIGAAEVALGLALRKSAGEDTRLSFYYGEA